MDATDNLCHRLLQEATRTLDAEQGSVMLLDPQENTLRDRAIEGVHMRYVDYVRQRPGEGIAGGVMESGEPLLVRDIADHPELSDRMRARYRTRSFLCVPIQLNDDRMGVVNITDKRGGASLINDDLQRLQHLTGKAALGLDRIRALEENEAYRQASLKDHRTGLLNPQAFDRRLEQEVAQVHRYPEGNSFSLLVLGIDLFRNINNNFGYLAGDDCIVSCAQLLERETRGTDSVFRRGGEEFTVILPLTGKTGARAVARRLKRAVRDHRVVTHHAPHPLSFTVSIGVATFPEDADSPETLFQKGVQRLHWGKKHPGWWDDDNGDDPEQRFDDDPDDDPDDGPNNGWDNGAGRPVLV